MSERVVSNSDVCLRGTLDEGDVTWDVGPKQPVALANARPLKRAELTDTYERAWRDPEAFFTELLEQPPLEREGVLSNLSLNHYANQEIPLRVTGAVPKALHRTAKGKPCVLLPLKSPALFALLRRLPLERAVDVALTLLEGWLGDTKNLTRRCSAGTGHEMAKGEQRNPNSRRYDNQLRFVSGALTLVVSEAWKKKRFASLVERWPGEAKRFRRVLDGVAGQSVEVGWLTAALDAVPGAVPLKGFVVAFG